jgi:enoyl-CoA hydratase
MSVDEVRYERVGAASVVTIDRQHRRNAIDGATADALVAALDQFEADEESRVLVLTGAGEAFCSGADLKALESLSPRLQAGEGPLGFTRRVPTKPAIAAIDGWAVAGGLELALWCDLRVVSPRSQLGCLERRFGVPLVDGGTWRLPRVVGLGRALDLILTARVLAADEALAMGLITEVAVDPMARALELAELLAAYPQSAMLSDRASVYDGYGLAREDALVLEGRYGLAVLADGESGAERFARGEGRGGSGT